MSNACYILQWLLLVVAALLLGACLSARCVYMFALESYLSSCLLPCYNPCFVSSTDTFHHSNHRAGSVSFVRLLIHNTHAHVRI